MCDPSHIGALIKLAGFWPEPPNNRFSLRKAQERYWERKQELIDEQRAIDKSDQEADKACRALERLSSIEKHRKYLSDLRNKRLPDPSPLDYSEYLLDKMYQHHPLYKLTHGKSYQEELDSAYDDAVKDVQKYIRSGVYTPGSPGAKRLEEHSRTV